MIILVKGITGSGKTFITTKLPKGIKCIDTDEYYYNMYEKKKKPLQEIHKYVVEQIKNEIKKHKFVVITGTMDEITYDRTYFIKLTNVKQAYKRVITRELIKYKQITTSSLLNNVQKMDPSKINLYLRMTYKAGIDPLSITYEDYVQKYEQKLKKQDPTTIIKTQQEIIKDITNLYQRQ